MRVLKVGGNELDDPAFLDLLGASAASLSAKGGDPLVIVHGGGRAIAGLQARLGLETIKVDGLRVTDQASLDVAQMVLSGQSNKVVVKALLEAGVDALGLSGIDGGLLRCHKKQHATADLGYVGEIGEVRCSLLKDLARLGYTAVVSPISLGVDGQAYNVNADEAAAAIALACGATELSYVSNVPGVMREGEVLPRLTADEAEELIAAGVVSAGMIPKVRTAVQAVQSGIAGARIVDLAGLMRDGGTLVCA